MSVFRYFDYKQYVNERIGNLPKQGHGEYRRMSQTLRVSTTLMSQVFRGDKQLSLEMAADLCDYLQLEDTEAQYFLLLVEYQKSSSTNLKEKLMRRIREEQKRAVPLTKKSEHSEERELTEEDKAIFYSSWVYSGIRNLCAIKDYQKAEDMAQRLGIPILQIQKILDYLTAHNLLLESEGRYSFGPASAQTAAKSPFMLKHHQNWRIQALQKMVYSDDQNLFFTGPMNMSKEAAQKIREELPAFISRIVKVAGTTEAEVVRCLNIDWFDY